MNRIHMLRNMAIIIIVMIIALAHVFVSYTHTNTYKGHVQMTYNMNLCKKAKIKQERLQYVHSCLNLFCVVYIS